MKAIVAIDKNGGIGKNGKLLFHISDDLKRFKRLTKGGIVVMGRKTLESLPNGRPLPYRTNIVMTRNDYRLFPGAAVQHSVQGVLDYIEEFGQGKEVFIIGGGEIYNQFLDLCDELYITQVDEVYDADAFFPKLNPNIWALEEEDISDTFHDDDTGLSYRYLVYHKK